MKMQKLLRLAAAAVGAVLMAGVGLALANGTAYAAPSKRTVVYYQTQYRDNTYVSPKPLTDNNTGVTDVLVAALHLNGDGTVHLNDHPPGDPRYDQMWTDLAAMQARGVNVSVMVGGAAQGSFQRLDTEFAAYYPKLKNVITTYNLDGVDLDVEENMSLAGIERVIDALRADFGADFVISMSPVASALWGGGNLSGFNYETLYRERGSKIDFFNGQFYCGWGSLANTNDYDRIMNRNLIPADKVVTGSVTDPSMCAGYVDVTTTLKNTVQSLVAKYPTFGGVAGWEYFISQPGGTARPWEWAGLITSYMKGGSGGTNLALNKAATGSTPCNANEGPAKAFNGSVSGGNSDKFCSLVSPAWLQVDLGAAYPITSFEVSHAGAGGESAAYNTKAFTIQVSTDGSSWSTPVTVTANTASLTTHPVSVTGRYVKLNVTTPTQGSDPATRIYELKVYGSGTAPPPSGCTGSNGDDVAIPDLSTVESSITISGCSGSASASSTAEVHIRHTYRGDLVVSLVAPDGSAYTLLNRSGGSADNVDQTFTVDLSGEPRNGTWKLRVRDAAAQDTGTIDTWTLTL
ncbi:MAG: proprotein convertase P-domain-containing protein [Micromonosporaceae bacterium]